MKKISPNDYKPYEARGHFLTQALRISGKEVTGSQKFWVGISHFEPGGGVDYSGEDAVNEKVYIVMNGEVTVRSKTEEFILKPMEALYIGPGEGRSIKNNTQQIASMLVVVNY